MDTQNYVSEILDIVRSDLNDEQLNEKLFDYHENDLADAFDELEISERTRLCNILDLESLSNIFEYLETDKAAEYLSEIDLSRAAAIASHIEADDLSEVLAEIPKDRRISLLNQMDDESKKALLLVSTYDDDEIGSHMTMNFISIRKYLTIKQAMGELVRQAANNDNIATIFVVDGNNVFYGAINLPDLIRARQSDQLEDTIQTSYPYVYGHEHVDDALETLKDYSEDSIPVLDEDNKLLGVITSSSIIDLVDDALGDDYAKLAGLTSEEDLKETLPESMKKRLPWLLILLVLGMFVSSVVGVFETVVSQLTIIMAFQSLILDMAGNVGTQSLAVTIRVLTDENLTLRQKAKLVAKEMRVGFANGLLLGVLAFFALGIYIMVFKQRSMPFAFAVSGCIGISLIVSMVISSLVGTSIPLFFNKIGFDPAVASGPLITTVNDLVAVVLYYGLNWLLLIQILGLGG